MFLYLRKIEQMKEKYIGDNSLGQPLDIPLLTTAGRMIVIDNSCVISDNLEDNTPIDISSINGLHSGRLKMPFRIQFNMMLLCLQGSMTLRLNRVEHRLSAGDMLNCVERNIGQYEDISPDARLIMIAFNREFGGGGLALNIASSFSDALLEKPCIHLEQEDVDSIFGIYRMLKRRVADTGYSYKRELVESAMRTIYYSIESYVTTPARTDGQKSKRSQWIFRDFTRLVGEYASRHRDLAFYADKLCISSKHLSKTVLETSGVTARQWIVEQVVLEAKALLKEGRLSIQQISEALNFPNQSFFGVFFKKSTGMSPNAYRHSN